jgi:hypothetical protein
MIKGGLNSMDCKKERFNWYQVTPMFSSYIELIKAKILIIW